MEKKRRSTGMMVVGIIVSGLGGVGILTGLGITLAGDDMVQGGVGTLVASALVAGAVGRPRAVVGSKKVDPKTSKTVPEIRVSPLGGSLTWSF